MLKLRYGYSSNNWLYTTRVSVALKIRAVLVYLSVYAARSGEKLIITVHSFKLSGFNTIYLSTALDNYRNNAQFVSTVVHVVHCVIHLSFFIS